jgi:capsule polysaccharide modification protein KpsS
MTRYLAETAANNRIVIPQKDRHQYTSAFRKVVNWRNARRLAEKLRDKHLLRKEQEFGHIGTHVAAHARMILASRTLARHYTDLHQAGEFVYYPLHVPGDVALTLRSPEYLDQAALIDYLCRVTPTTLNVAVKEHPAMIGAMGAETLLRLKRRYDRFVILPPGTNNYDVLRRAATVVTVNSKSGAEAGMLGKPVLVLGDAFYRNAPFAQPIDRLEQLAPALGSALDRHNQNASPGAEPEPKAVQDYFAALWNRTAPGELYVETEQNIASFTASLLQAVQPASPGVVARAAAWHG